MSTAISRTRSRQAAFLRAIYAAPADRLPVLIYADWLCESGRGEQADAIRAGATPLAELLVATLDETDRVELCYLARRGRLAHPVGQFDNAGRWYPDEYEEGGCPAVREPSAAWPYSYMVSCRTKKWCAQLPDWTRDADAATALAAILGRRVKPTGRLAYLFLTPDQEP